MFDNEHNCVQFYYNLFYCSIFVFYISISFCCSYVFWHDNSISLIKQTKKENIMKTKSLLFAGLLIVGFLFQPFLSQANNADFKKALSKTVKYPAQASEKGLEGTIWVSIEVDQEGTMTVNQSNHACCDKLHDKVIDQLDGKKIKKFNENMVGTHNIKLVFDLEK